MTRRTLLRNVAIAVATIAVTLGASAAPAAAAGPAYPLRNPLATSRAGEVGGMLAVGAAHTCAVVNGGVLCWGDNARGQLGDGTRVDHRTAAPVLVAAGGAALTGATRVAAGSNFTCALLADGTVRCWGAGSDGQLGRGHAAGSSVPVSVAGITGATGLEAGGAHACAILGDGSVRCWGRNDHGQLGDGTRTNRSTPVRPIGIDAATRLAAGVAHTCAISGSAQVVRCWGANAQGQLGDGTAKDRLTPVTAGEMTDVLDLVAGDAHTCAVASVFDPWEGGYSVAMCWGANAARQADPSSPAKRILAPTEVTWIEEYGSLAAGARHTCLAADGGVGCWGENASGQLGDGTRVRGGTGAVVGLGQVDRLAAGGGTSCAMVSNEIFAAYAWCWGENAQGQVGNGRTRDRTVPTVALRVAGDPPALPLAGARALGVSAYHSCTILGDGSVRCWGDNSVAELGDGTAAVRASAVKVGKLAGAQSMAAGLAHTCVVTDTGAVRCWGYNYSGQLGDGTTNHRSTPVAAKGVVGAVAVAAGLVHTCAILGDTSVVCWGENEAAQLGDGSVRSRTVAAPVRGLTGATQLALGETHSCALLAAGTVSCWGSNAAGEVGDGTLLPRRTPMPVAGVAGAVAITAGSGFTCALLSDGSVTCWGAAPGRVVDMFPTDPDAAPLPFTVPGIAGATTITAGFAHVCALLGDGSVRCWGLNQTGELGDGTTQPREGAVAVAGLVAVTSIDAGGSHTCAIAGPESRVYCWGSGRWYELGHGLPQRSARPVRVVAR